MLLVPLILVGVAWVIWTGSTRSAEALIAIVAVAAVAAVSLDAAAVILLLASMSLIQPFALGAGHTTLGSALACAAGLAALIGDSTGRHERATASSRSVFVWVAASGVWSVMIASQHNGLDLGASMRSLESLCAVVGAAVVILRDAHRRLWFSRALVLIMAAFCASYCVTFLLWLKDGFGSHVVGGISVRGYSVEPVYLPLTPTSGAALVHGRLIPRLLGPMREPGLFQAVLIWSLFMLARLRLPRRRLGALILVGILGTQSTAGLGILLVVYILTRVVLADSSGRVNPLRHFAGLAGLVIALYVVVFAPTIGIQAKQSINAASVDDRWTNTRAGLVTLVQAPLGRDYTDFPPNVGINMLAATTLVGAPGLAIGLLAFVRPMSRSGRRSDALSTGLPLFVTALFAEPVMDAPGVFVLLIAGLLPYVLDAASLAPADGAVSAVDAVLPRLEPAALARA